jgi:DNA-binding beta-propeller fold protein YncE
LPTPTEGDYVSSTQLQAQPTTAELATPGITQLTVTNPSPGTISPTVTFNVTYSINITVLDLSANGLVWDRFAQVIYASLPSSDGPTGNSIAVINPSTSAVTGTFFAGSEPTILALDSTSKHLYVGLNGNGSMQRLNLPSFTQDIDIPLGNPQNSAPYVAAAIAVSPTNSHMIATAITQNGCCLPRSLSGIREHNLDLGVELH